MERCPLGISILAVLFAITGFITLAIQVLFSSELMDAFSSLSASAISSMVFLAIVGLLSIAAGITLWMGRPEGWWLGISNLSLSVLRNAWALYLVYQTATQDSQILELAPRLYLKHGLRVCFDVALLFYFFRPQVLSYFKGDQSQTSA